MKSVSKVELSPYWFLGKARSCGWKYKFKKNDTKLCTESRVAWLQEAETNLCSCIRNGLNPLHSKFAQEDHVCWLRTKFYGSSTYSVVESKARVLDILRPPSVRIQDWKTRELNKALSVFLKFVGILFYSLKASVTQKTHHNLSFCVWFMEFRKSNCCKMFSTLPANFRN